VFIVNTTDIGAAHAMLEALPLGKAHHGVRTLP